MPVFKNESNGTWYVMARYVNWKGERKQKCKKDLNCLVCYNMYKNLLFIISFTIFK